MFEISERQLRLVKQQALQDLLRSMNNQTNIIAVHMVLDALLPQRDTNKLIFMIYSHEFDANIRDFNPEAKRIESYGFEDSVAWETFVNISVKKISYVDILGVLNDDKIYEFEEFIENMYIIVPDSFIYAVSTNYIKPYDLVLRYGFTKKALMYIADQLQINRFNLAIAGGIFSVLFGNNIQKLKESDIDLFIIAQSKEEAYKNVSDFCEHMKLWSEVPYITSNCITFNCSFPVRLFEKIKIQLILRWHNTPSQIIEKFDIAPAMIYMHQDVIYCNAEAKFAYQTGYMIANIERRRNNYAYRIKKYLNRNIGILFYECNFELRTQFTLDGINFRIESSEDRYLICLLRKIDGQGIKQNYYCTDKKYDELELTIDNIYASMYNINSSTITGHLSANVLEYTPLVNMECLLHKLNSNTTPENILFLIRLLKRLKINEDLPMSLFNTERIKEFIITKFSRSFINLHSKYTASLEHYTNPMYEFKCPLQPSAAVFYGDYYLPYTGPYKFSD